MPVDYMARIHDKYTSAGYTPYRWVVNTAPPPWQPVLKPLSEIRLGLIASGGIYVTGQVAFHYKDDISWRAIPTDVNTADLRATHFAYDLTDARQDPNVVFPIDPLRHLVAEGFLGGAGRARLHLYGWHLFGPTGERRSGATTAERLLLEHIDAVLLVPV